MPLIEQPSPPAGGALLARLHAIKAEHGYLPEEELRRAAEELEAPLSQLVSAASFYASFSLEPQGRYTIQVCHGTACYIRGGAQLLSELESTLEIEAGGTTADRLFTLETVYCLGSCSMAPVIRVDYGTHGGHTYGRLKVDQIPRILEKYQKQEQEPET
jgi:NADH-quinone oxidoreductase subunit E